MNSLQHIPICIVFLLLSACRVQSPGSESMGRQLAFGYGGGFTGEVTTYTLQEDGRMASKTGLADQGEEKSLPRIKPNEAQRFLNRAESLTSEYPDVDAPGNRYFFIRYQEGDTTRTLTWGKPEYQVPEPVQELYQALVSKISPEQ